MRRIPGEPGDYVWIAIGLAMMGAGLLPFLSGGSDDDGLVASRSVPPAPDNGLAKNLPPSTPARTPSPLPTLPDITGVPIPPPNGTAA